MLYIECLIQKKRLSFALSYRCDINISGKCSSNPPWCCPSCLRGGQERSVMSAMVDGYVFHPGGIAVHPHMITTALVHDFSNFIEAEAYKRTLDRFHHVNYCVISPAMEKIESGYLTAFRLYRCPHKNTRKMHHEFLTDLVFVQKYDKDLRPHGPGYFLSFAYHRFEGMELWDGPQDPRAFKVNSSMYLLFHAAVYRHQNGTQALLEPIIWDLEKNLPGIPDLKDNPLTHNNPLMFIHDKNWMPLVHNDQLFLVQLLDPTVVISCTLDAVCKYSQNVSSARNPFARYFTLRGGSQFQLWQYPYYIGAVHSRSFSTRGSITYGEIAAHLVLISVHNFRFVFVTDFLHLNNSIFKRSKLKHLAFYESAFFFPVSLVVESKDSILVGGHINDDRSVLVRIRGIKYMMEDAIKRDQSLNPEALKPKRRVVQRFFRRLYAQKRRARRLKP